MQAVTVFQEQLVPLGHGIPLWFPEPDSNVDCGEILVGDVGYLRDGSFFRFFNATLPADDPINSSIGVPEDFERLVLPSHHFQKRPHYLPANPNVICSASVSRREANTDHYRCVHRHLVYLL